ncbi:MAG: hypothetical protein WCT10_03530 [Patescibacteria group bacterium]
MEKCRYCGGVGRHENECPAMPEAASETADKTGLETEATPEKERRIDAALEDLLELHLVKLGEGNNGVILKFDENELPTEIFEELKACDIILGPDQATKIIKIYHGGVGKREYDLQCRAREIAELKADDPDYASVPRAYLYRDLPITKKSVRDRLRNLTKEDLPTDRVELFMMDLIKGDDLAIGLYKEIIRRHPKTIHLAADVDSMRFEDLMQTVSEILQFNAPGGKAKDPAARDFEETKVFSENSEKIFRFLGESGFRVDSAIITQIKNTMDLFHQNGLAYRDAHHRNFLIRGGIEQPPAGSASERPKVFIIDYGNAVEFDQEYSDDLLVEGTKRYPDDHAVVRTLEKMNAFETRHAKVNKDIREFHGRLIKSKNAKWLEFTNRFQPGSAVDLDRVYAATPNLTSNRAENFAAVAIELINKELITAQDIKDFIEKKASSLPPPERNLLLDFTKSL